MKSRLRRLNFETKSAFQVAQALSWRQPRDRLLHAEATRVVVACLLACLESSRRRMIGLEGRAVGHEGFKLARNSKTKERLTMADEQSLRRLFGPFAGGKASELDPAVRNGSELTP